MAAYPRYLSVSGALRTCNRRPWPAPNPIGTEIIAPKLRLLHKTGNVLYIITYIHIPRSCMQVMFRTLASSIEQEGSHASYWVPLAGQPEPVAFSLRIV